MSTPTTGPNAASKVDYLRFALRLIGTDCESFVSPSTCIGAGRSPYAKYGADAWCNGCIARTALNNDAFPAWGTSGVEEVPVEVLP